PRRRRDDSCVRRRHLAAGPRAFLALEDFLKLALMLQWKLVNRVEIERPTRGKFEFARQQSVQGSLQHVRAAWRMTGLRLKLRTTHEDERAFTPRAAVESVSDRFLARPRRASQQQRLGAQRLSFYGFSEGANRRALAHEPPVPTAPPMPQQIFSGAQLALERSRSFRDAHFERRIGQLQLFGCAPPIVVQLRVTDRARDLVRDDRHQAEGMLVKRLPHRALDREHAYELVADKEGNCDLALCVWQTGDRDHVADFHAATGLHHLPPLRRGVRTLLSQVVQL